MVFFYVLYGLVIGYLLYDTLSGLRKCHKCKKFIFAGYQIKEFIVRKNKWKIKHLCQKCFIEKNNIWED